MPPSPASPRTTGHLLTLEEIRDLRRLPGLRGTGLAHALLLTEGDGPHMERAPSYRDVFGCLTSGSCGA